MNKGKKFNCSLCEKEYLYLKNLRRHEREDHAFTRIKALFCDLCPAQYNSNRGLKIHKEKKHDIVPKSYEKMPQCSVCKEAVVQNKMEIHLFLCHDIELKTEKLEFSTFEDFLEWKETVEKETLSRFSKNKGSSKTKKSNSIRHSFVCQRSGKFKRSSTANIQKIKTQGSKKINGVCPASMRVLERENGHCDVKYISTHVGHTNDLCHITLTESERTMLAEKIASNTPFSQILEDVRDSASDSNVQRIHCLTKKDLQNIKQKVDLNASEINDLQSNKRKLDLKQSEINDLQSNKRKLDLKESEINDLQSNKRKLDLKESEVNDLQNIKRKLDLNASEVNDLQDIKQELNLNASEVNDLQNIKQELDLNASEVNDLQNIEQKSDLNASEVNDLQNIEQKSDLNASEVKDMFLVREEEKKSAETTLS